MKKRNILGLVVSIIMILAISLVSACTESKTTPIPLMVISANPANSAQGVPVSNKITATFNRAMTPSTLTTATFTVKQGETPVSGTVTYDGTTATFTPTTILAFCTIYTATITIGAKDLGGNALANDYVWNFFTTCPTESKPGTRGGPTTRGYTGSPPITVKPNGIPTNLLPTVISTIPVDTATGVAVNSQIFATFSQAMNRLTITNATFTLMQGVTPVAGAVTFAGLTAIFTPAASLAPGTTYTATITTGARDLSGNALAFNKVWTFTTAAAAGQAGPATVVLGQAANYAVLAGSTVTNVVSVGTIVTGDLGLSPGSAVTGFPPGVLIGTQHVNDSSANQAKLDLTTAYNDAAGRTLAPITVSGNIGGRTLTPGLYKSTSTLEISSGDLTLDAQGNANAVFIFQIASTLTTTSGRQVILSGGAQAKNIFWQVGTSATLGTGSVFEGTILADQSITLTTGATLHGRALARIAAVTLDASIVTKPAP
ncbi:MAG: ice-binding family protein [Dehalococcoidia bacterium]